MKRTCLIISCLLIGFTAACNLPGGSNANPNGPPDGSGSPPTETASVPQISGDCANPFLAVSPNRTWVYSTEATGLPTAEYRLHYDEVTQDSFTAYQTFSEQLTTEVTWLCGKEGLITSEFANINIDSLSDGTIEFEALDFSGQTLPPAEDWAVGHTWSSAYQMAGTFVIEGVLTDADIELTVQNEITATEELSVSAGDYPEAYRVDSTGTMIVTISMGETVIPGIESTFDFTTWYVRDVGMIKTTATYEGSASTVELLSLE